MDAAHDFSDGRRAAHLEADVEADAALGALANFESVLGLGDIDPEGFFAVGVFARCYGSVEMLDVEPGRRGNLDGVDRFGSGEFFEGMGAAKHQAGVDGGHAERGVDLVEVRFGGGELIGKQVGKGHDAGGRVLRKGCRHGGATAAAAEQSDADCGVGFVAESRARAEDHDAGCSRTADEFSSIHDVGFL